MAIDPVCKMEVEESKAAATSEYKGENTISVPWGVRRLSTKTRRNTWLNKRSRDFIAGIYCL